MGHMKDFDRRIRQGGDDAIAAVEEYVAEQERLIAQVQSMLQRACDMGWKEWIPARDRLPDVLERVLVFCPLLDPNEIIGATRTASGIWECDDGQIIGEEEPTHWMPLPAPPPDAK